MKSSAAGLFMVMIATSSCMPDFLKSDQNAEFETVSVKDEYEISVPSYMRQVTTLNDDASLQCQNLFKETYLIIIDENKQEFVDIYTDNGQYDSAQAAVINYAETQLSQTTSGIDVISREPLKKKKISGLRALSTQIDGRIEGVEQPISYFFTFVESRDKLYMIMAWTLQDRKDRYAEPFERMANSFRLAKKRSAAPAA